MAVQAGFIEAEFWRNGESIAVTRHRDGTVFADRVAIDPHPAVYPMVAIRRKGFCGLNFGRHGQWHHTPACLEALPWPRVPAFSGHKPGGYRAESPPPEPEPEGLGNGKKGEC